jgi:hypothetical protein
MPRRTWWRQNDKTLFAFHKTSVKIPNLLLEKLAIKDSSYSVDFHLFKFFIFHVMVILRIISSAMLCNVNDWEVVTATNNKISRNSEKSIIFAYLRQIVVFEL